MKTTLETSENENYTRNEWRWKLHSKRVEMKTTLETSEDENFSGKATFEKDVNARRSISVEDFVILG